MAVFTHVLQYSSGQVCSLDWTDLDEFSRVLRRFDGVEHFVLLLWALPPGMDYKEGVAAGADREYLQALGRADAMTVEICKAGGAQWGVDWVRYVIGHPHDGDEVQDVPIVLPRSTEMRSRQQLFDADEAAQLFYSYYKTGDIPPGYTLRPEQGFTKDGGNIDLRPQVSGQL
ncbi:hypothetical protein KIH27_04855 [Mycobacterium sp. M1]|uniref:Uncharacterized protein n=1 Tax=Mycolicibacter acidiphilus TaxID=2835306 RepID=A0ABS5RFZ2_9MYCO|nr:hypothetical protein [Mycolicibacter acidiphilus]MBS9532917.1 hypothetical protein [Mycolicibacter acidiphilus]